MVSLMEVKTECAVCPVKIWQADGNRLKKTDEYREVDVQLNDQTLMRVGVCSNHTKPNKLELEVMTEKTHMGWMEEVAFGVGDEAWVRNKGLNLKVVGVNHA